MPMSCLLKAGLSNSVWVGVGVGVIFKPEHCKQYPEMNKHPHVHFMTRLRFSSGILRLYMNPRLHKSYNSMTLIGLEILLNITYIQHI